MERPCHLEVVKTLHKVLSSVFSIFHWAYNYWWVEIKYRIKFLVALQKYETENIKVLITLDPKIAKYRNIFPSQE